MDFKRLIEISYITLVYFTSTSVLSQTFYIRLLPIRNVSSTVFTISWSAPDNQFTKFQLFITSIKEQYFVPKDCPSSKSRFVNIYDSNVREATFTLASPLTSYEIYAKGLHPDINMTSNIQYVTTLEGPSEMPRNVQAVPLANDLILFLAWDLPCNSNGLLTHHSLKFVGTHPRGKLHEDTQIIPIPDLYNEHPQAYFMVRPGYSYTIYLKENSEAFFGIPYQFIYNSPD